MLGYEDERGVFGVQTGADSYEVYAACPRGSEFSYFIIHYPHGEEQT